MIRTRITEVTVSDPLASIDCMIGKGILVQYPSISQERCPAIAQAKSTRSVTTRSNIPSSRMRLRPRRRISRPRSNTPNHHSPGAYARTTGTRSNIPSTPNGAGQAYASRWPNCESETNLTTPPEFFTLQSDEVGEVTDLRSRRVCRR